MFYLLDQINKRSRTTTDADTMGVNQTDCLLNCTASTEVDSTIDSTARNKNDMRENASVSLVYINEYFNGIFKQLNDQSLKTTDNTQLNIMIENDLSNKSNDDIRTFVML